VYSGGGIEPDKHLAGPTEGFNPTPFGRMLQGRAAFENYAVKFMVEGDGRISQESSGRRTVRRGFEVDDAMIAEFRDQLKADRIRIDEAAFEKDLVFIKSMIRYRIDEVLFGIAEARRRLINVDPQAQLALTMLPEAEKLKGLGQGTQRAQ